jgi:signal transduction histidine kinase/FixJ family two-component response regulator
MKLKTLLRLSAVFPLIPPLAVILLMRWRFGSLSAMNPPDIVVVALLCVTSIAMTGLVLSFNRRILERIERLNAWTESILAGKIDSKIPVPNSNDEVAHLARAFEKILGDIKESYATLHKEATAHKQLAELHEQRATASLIGTKHLSDALARLKNTQTKALTEERSKALEQIVRGVTHDISEALTPIMATAELLLARPELLDRKDALIEHIKGVRRSADQGREILRHLAGYFHQFPVSQNNVDMYYIVLSAIAQAKSEWLNQATQSSNRVTLRTNLDIVPSIAGNEADLRDGVVELLRNAFEAMPDGGAITVVTRATPSGAVVEIRDTGKGMQEEEKRRAQEPFFTTKGLPHRGMGLTRIASTVRSHGGDIRIESEPGAGTQITLTFPARHAAANTEDIIETSPQASKDMDVIVVDDDTASRDVVAMVVSMNGHRVATAADANECLTQMRTKPFDIAILDLEMPGMRGDELAANIARDYPLTAIVMLTGMGNIMMEEGNIPEHVDFLVSKPVTSKELISVLQKAPQAHNNSRKPRQQDPVKPVPSLAQGANSSRMTAGNPGFKWEG